MRATNIQIRNPHDFAQELQYPQITHNGQTLLYQLKPRHQSIKGSIAQNVRFYDKYREDHKYVGPGQYDPRTSDSVNSKVKGVMCSSVFGKRPGNAHSFENSHEYVIIGQQLKHLPELRNCIQSKKTLKKLVIEQNNLTDSVTVQEIYKMNQANLSQAQSNQNKDQNEIYGQQIDDIRQNIIKIKEEIEIENNDSNNYSPYSEHYDELQQAANSISQKVNVLENNIQNSQQNQDINEKQIIVDQKEIYNQDSEVYNINKSYRKKSSKTQNIFRKNNQQSFNSQVEIVNKNISSTGMKINPYIESGMKFQGDNIFPNSENHETFQSSAQSKSKHLNMNRITTNLSSYQQYTENQNNQLFLNDDIQVISAHNQINNRPLTQIQTKRKNGTNFGILKNKQKGAEQNSLQLNQNIQNPICQSRSESQLNNQRYQNSNQYVNYNMTNPQNQKFNQGIIQQCNIYKPINNSAIGQKYQKRNKNNQMQSMNAFFMQNDSNYQNSFAAFNDQVNKGALTQSALENRNADHSRNTQNIFNTAFDIQINPIKQIQLFTNLNIKPQSNKKQFDLNNSGEIYENFKNYENNKILNIKKQNWRLMAQQQRLKKAEKQIKLKVENGAQTSHNVMNTNRVDSSSVLQENQDKQTKGSLELSSQEGTKMHTNFTGKEFTQGFENNICDDTSILVNKFNPIDKSSLRYMRNKKDNLGFSADNTMAISTGNQRMVLKQYKNILKDEEQENTRPSLREYRKQIEKELYSKYKDTRKLSYNQNAYKQPLTSHNKYANHLEEYRKYTNKDSSTNLLQFNKSKKNKNQNINSFIMQQLQYFQDKKNNQGSCKKDQNAQSVQYFKDQQP